MSTPSSRTASTGARLSLRFVALALLLASAFPTMASAAVAPAVLQPLGIVGDASRPSCTSPLAPLEPTDRVGEDEDYDEYPITSPAAAELTATSYAFEFLPAVGICSPTFAGIPGPIGGTIATAPKRTRVGTGWRELGGTFTQPAALTPGDVITLPEVDDAAVARLSVARSSDRPTSVIALSDLAPGPSTVTISEDERGLVARLVRGDGSTAEGAAKPIDPPPLTAKISGSRTRWVLEVRLLPGTAAFASAYAYSGSYAEQTLVGTASADGTLRLSIRPPKTRRPRRQYIRMLGVAVNRPAHTFSGLNCDIESDRRGRPRTAACSEDVSDELLSDDSIDTPFDDWGALRGRVREFVGVGARAVGAGARFVQTVAGAAHVPFVSAPATRKETTPSPQPVAHRNAVMGRSASRVGDAPLVARQVARSAAIRGGGVSNPRPLAGDVNGDGAPDFWTDVDTGVGESTPPLRSTAGYVLLSSPSGLVTRRVDLPGLSPYRYLDSEISAMADVTGDGIGELVVDVNERHALIPGSRSWTSSPAPIRVLDPTDLAPTDLLLQPSASSPGAPYAAIDDASGDGRRDLVATDDLGGWFAVASSDLRAGTVTRLPTVTRAVPVPKPVKAALTFEPAAPRVDPRVRVIAGQAVALRWPVVAGTKAPEGTVEVAVRTGTGAGARPPIRVKTPGNALLLDYDRVSGDVLLLAVAPRCTTGRNYLRGRCRETVMRVRADGSVRQSLTVNPRSSISYVGATRFITDGPDADGDADAVYTVGNRGLGLMESTRTGALSETSAPIAGIVTVDRPFYEELRLLPIVEPSGARTLTVAVPVDTSARDPYSYARTAPAVIGWK